ncbi:MAG: hypothetical protein ACI9DJ_002891 [Algoriphagus sp.]
MVVTPPETEPETEAVDSTIVAEPSLTITQNPDPVLPGTQHQLLTIEIKDVLPGQKIRIGLFKMTFSSSSINNQSVRPMLPFVNKDSVKVSFLTDNTPVKSNDYTHWNKPSLWEADLYVDDGKEFLTINTEQFKEVHKGRVNVDII